MFIRLLVIFFINISFIYNFSYANFNNIDAIRLANEAELDITINKLFQLEKNGALSDDSLIRLKQKEQELYNISAIFSNKLEKTKKALNILDNNNIGQYFLNDLIILQESDNGQYLSSRLLELEDFVDYTNNLNQNISNIINFNNFSIIEPVSTVNNIVNKSTLSRNYNNFKEVIWIDNFITKSKQDNNYKDNGYGFILGLNRYITDNILIGALYSNAFFESDNINYLTNSKINMGAFYLFYILDSHIYINNILSLSLNNYKTKRIIIQNDIANAKFKSKSYSNKFKIGYKLPINLNFKTNIILSFRYFLLDIEPYSEINSISAYNFPYQLFENLESEVGIEILKDKKIKNINLNMLFGISWLYDIKKDNYIREAKWAQYPEISGIRSNDINMLDNKFNLFLALEVKKLQNLSLSLVNSNILSKNYNSHSILLKLSHFF